MALEEGVTGVPLALSLEEASGRVVVVMAMVEVVMAMAAVAMAMVMAEMGMGEEETAAPQTVAMGMVAAVRATEEVVMARATEEVVMAMAMAVVATRAQLLGTP